MPHPARPGTDCSEFQPVPIQESANLLDIECLGFGRKNLDGVEA